jgi:hypothetical protein
MSIMTGICSFRQIILGYVSSELAIFILYFTRSIVVIIGNLLNQQTIGLNICRMHSLFIGTHDASCRQFSYIDIE